MVILLVMKNLTTQVSSKLVLELLDSWVTFFL